MRGTTVQVAQVVSIVTEECCSCGVIFGMTSQLRSQRLDDHRSFWCPNGHVQTYVGETEAAKNARLLREEQARHQRTLARENDLAAEKTKLEHKLKRVSRGVCPECKRTFPNLARHMACKHGAAVEAK